VPENSEEPLMNELKLGDVTITRIEEMYGPIMPPEQFFPEMPEEARRKTATRWCPTIWTPTAAWSAAPSRPGCCAAAGGPS
jgi:hypothetical protein